MGGVGRNAKHFYGEGRDKLGLHPLLSTLSAVKAKPFCLSHPWGDLSCFEKRTIPPSR